MTRCSDHRKERPWLILLFQVVLICPFCKSFNEAVLMHTLCAAMSLLAVVRLLSDFANEMKRGNLERGDWQRRILHKKMSSRWRPLYLYLSVHFNLSSPEWAGCRSLRGLDSTALLLPPPGAHINALSNEQDIRVLIFCSTGSRSSWLAGVRGFLPAGKSCSPSSLAQMIKSQD